ncbi:hypothetical protein NUM3379_00980 [Kineococcus sp. NUM-3379]
MYSAAATSIDPGTAMPLATGSTASGSVLLPADLGAGTYRVEVDGHGTWGVQVSNDGTTWSAATPLAVQDPALLSGATLARFPVRGDAGSQAAAQEPPRGAIQGQNPWNP